MSDYVTVVSVDLPSKPPPAFENNAFHEQETKSSFVTVLSINNNQNTTTISTLENPNEGEIVTVYRLPGERLGFGLKFQGGTKTNEKVQRLFVQSCDPDSPASKARASWGSLGEGDEILQIDGEPVTSMTRIECVKCLKDRNVAINLFVKKRDMTINRTMRNGADVSLSKKRPLPPPPPVVPPRKINKKPTIRETNQAPVSQRNIAMESPTPVVAESYLNILDDEINRNDESDETGSTISSQISVISNFSLESDHSLMSSNASSSDLTKILTKPFQMIEREFNVNNVSRSDPPITISIDNLLLNDLASSDEIDNSAKVQSDIKPINNYENVDSQRQYENIDIKLPPIPRPRSISLPQDTGEIDAKTPTKTIESWLNDANTINGNTSNGEIHISSVDNEEDYDAIKFECFGAGDDGDDEKLGPPELLNISEAYFNFSWCGNSTNNLPTIGEAEEELNSLEPACPNKKSCRGPIFIVHTVRDSEDDNDEKNVIDKNDACLISERDSAEINNNSFYLHECEDKGDNNDKGMQCENSASQTVETFTSGFSREKLVNSLNKIVIAEMMSTKEEKVSSDEEIEKLESEIVIQLPDDAIKVYDKIAEAPDERDNENSRSEVITSDSERLDSKSDDEASNIAIKIPEKPMIYDPKSEMTQENVTKTQSKDMTSLPTQSTYQFSLDTEMEQKRFSSDRTATNGSRMPPDGHEFPTNKMSSSFDDKEKETKSDNTKINSIKTSPIITTKATAIVAPLVPRKSYQFEEINNVVASKPPFKSATLGHHRPIGWRNKDEKSEKSVKDKIAMFSNSTSDISLMMPTQQGKQKSSMFSPQRNGSVTKSIENIFSSHDVTVKSRVNESVQKKSMSVENLDSYDDFKVREKRDSKLYNKVVSKTAISHSPAMSPRPLTLNIGKAQSVENLTDSFESPKLPSLPPPTSAPALSRRISFSGYSNSQMKETREKSINNILENRKKGLSKLRGLVIPEKVPENEIQVGGKVLGLPVIRSKECDLIDGRNVFNRSISTPQLKDVHQAKSFNERKSEIQSLVKAAPRRLIDEIKNESQVLKSPPVKPPRTSLIVLPNSKSITTDESDTESCLSAKISTPPVSPTAKKPLTRTFSSETNTSVSSNSTLTSGSGSQASCSSSGSTQDTRVNKSAEGVSSRKSILASSKSRSGRDCLEKSWRDEDSTDGGIDNDDRKRTTKAKARSTAINYKVVSPNANYVDKFINVATYTEVVSSDSDDKPDTSEAIPTTPARYTPSKSISKKEVIQTSIMSDMAKWVRIEATKANEMGKKQETAVRITPKSLEPPKKLNLSEIRKNFEQKSAGVVTPNAPKSQKEKLAANHNRFSSCDSVASSSSGVSSELLGTGTGTHNSESMLTLQSDFGSFSSFGSSHSLITPQDLQLIIDEADPPLETQEAFVVVLQRETPESSIGITLAGGSDYEAKEITIHRILKNSPADKDRRLRRGDRLLSINGLSMRGLTHRESLSVLKSPRADVVMVVTRSKSLIKTNSLTKASAGSLGSLTSLTEKNDSAIGGTLRKKAFNGSGSMEVDLDAISNEDFPNQKNKTSQNGHSTQLSNDYKENDILTISIVKDGAGLGFSIDGGYDSFSGNKPLIIKKIFMGGAAERTSDHKLQVGDEILKINGMSIGKQTRIDVWNLMKNLPQGNAVQLTIKRK